MMIDSNINKGFSLVLLALSLAISGCDKQHADGHEHKEEAHEHKEKGHEHKEEAHDHKEGHDHEKEEGHDHEKHHVGKHVHGEGQVNVVASDNKLTIELRSPSMNVFGFEHNPATDEQKNTVKTQQALLEKGTQLFSINGGDCQLVDTKVDMPFKGDAHKAKDSHSDVAANYTYNCKKITALTDIDTSLFTKFAGFKKLHTSWVVKDTQGSSTLTKDNNNIKF